MAKDEEEEDSIYCREDENLKRYTSVKQRYCHHLAYVHMAVMSIVARKDKRGVLESRRLQNQLSCQTSCSDITMLWGTSGIWYSVDAAIARILLSGERKEA